MTPEESHQYLIHRDFFNFNKDKPIQTSTGGNFIQSNLWQIERLKIELADLVINNIAKIKIGLCNLNEFELAANIRELENKIKELENG